MRLLFAPILMAISASSAANASSIVVVGVPGPATPSVVTLGEPTRDPAIADAPRTAYASPSIERFGSPPPNFRWVSPSVIAMIDAPPPVAFENVASIGDGNGRRGDFMPMVIRGGIVGEAFVSRSAPVASSGESPASEPEQQVSAPAPGDPDPAPPQSAPDPEQEQVPKSALPPPAAPTGRME